eukprot:8769339-Prorocentrum_lima.AAC.1
MAGPHPRSAMSKVKNTCKKKDHNELCLLKGAHVADRCLLPDQHLLRLSRHGTYPVACMMTSRAMWDNERIL